jgi:hypothetical protein
MPGETRQAGVRLARDESALLINGGEAAEGIVSADQRGTGSGTVGRGLARLLLLFL